MQTEIYEKSKEHPSRKKSEQHETVYDLAEDVCLPAYILMNSLSAMFSPGSVPMYKPNHFGVRNTQTSCTETAPAEKFQHDKLLLFELFSDLVLLSQFMGNLPAEDELIRGVRDMRNGCPIPLRLAFAVQMFLDVSHTLGSDTDRGFCELIQGITTTRTTFDMTKDFLQGCRVENWPKSNDRVFAEILDMAADWVS